MKFVCDRCQTKYSIADERVRGKVLKVKCKTCANVITVREARRPSAAGLPTLSAGTRTGTTAEERRASAHRHVGRDRRADAARALPAESGRRSVPGSRRVRAARAGGQATDHRAAGARRRRGRRRPVVHGARRRAHRSVHQAEAGRQAAAAREERGRSHLERAAGRMEAAGRRSRGRRGDVPPARAAAAAAAARGATPSHAAADSAPGRIDVGRAVARTAGPEAHRVTHAPHARPSVACRSRRGRAGLEAAAAGRRSSGAGRARRARDRRRSVVAARDTGAAAAHASARIRPTGRRRTASAARGTDRREAAAPTSCRCSTCRAARRPRPARRRA